MELVHVYVYDDVLWVPCKDMFEKFGHVLNLSESELFFKNPFRQHYRVGSEGSNGLRREGQPQFFPGSHASN